MSDNGVKINFKDGKIKRAVEKTRKAFGPSKTYIAQRRTPSMKAEKRLPKLEFGNSGLFTPAGSQSLMGLINKKPDDDLRDILEARHKKDIEEAEKKGKKKQRSNI